MRKRIITGILARKIRPNDSGAFVTTLKIEALSIGALAGVNLTVRAGEVVCISGPSGSGKSRLLRAIADLEPHDGCAYLDDVSQLSMPASHWRRQAMMVPADSQWWFESVGEHFPEHCDLVALEAFGFSNDVMDWTVDRLSSGERQRLALLRAMARSPKALLLDEPTANLDEAMTRRVEAWLKAEIHKSQVPVIWVAHDHSQIERVADRHYVIAGTALEQIDGSD